MSQAIAVPIVDPLQMAWMDMSDLGNAERFVMHAGGLLRHVPDRGWIAYDGQRWSFQEGLRLATLKAHAVAKGLRDELQALRAVPDSELEKTFWPGCTSGMRDDRMAALGKHSIASGNHNKTQAMMAQAGVLLSVHWEEFDTDPLAFNVRNGTLRFHQDDDGKWYVKRHDHEPNDMISAMAEVEYDPDALCPAWMERLEVVQPEPDQRVLMQQIHGYSLVGIRDEQKFFLAQGRGGDGKSLTYAVISEIMGSYYAHADVSSFLAGARKSGSDHSEDLARLAGDIRLVTCDEPEKHATFNTKIIKQMTGGGKMTVRGLRVASFEYVPRWFLIMECNPMPRVPTSDEGFWRRCMPFQWPVQFSALNVKPEPFSQLKARLLDERSGILNWMLEGALAWLTTRELTVSERSQEVKDEYRRSSDPFGEWVMDRADITDPSVRTLAKDLYADFKEFCEAKDMEKIPSQKLFGNFLAERQHRRKKSMGVIYRQGIKLKPPDTRFTAGAANEGGDGRPFAPVDASGAPDTVPGFDDD